MIKDITIGRAYVSGTNPGQWTSNSQLSINNGYQLYILDPKLPNLHKSIVSQLEYSADNEDIQNTLNSIELFDQTPILHTDLLKSMNTCNFNRVNVVESSDSFNFGRISDPVIVKHQWSQVSKNTKDCVVGILLNTGELLVLKRVSRFLHSYEIVYNFFDIIASELDISRDSNGEYNMDAEQSSKLRIKDFEFVDLDGELIVSIVNELDELVLYQQNSFWMSIPVPGVRSYEIYDYDAELYVAYTTTSNEVILHAIESEKREVIFNSTRFRVSRLEWSDNLGALLIVYPGKLYVHRSSKTLEIKMPELSISSIVSFQNKLLIAYECGKFDIILVNDDSLNIEPCKGLNNFFSSRLINYQVASTVNESAVPGSYDIINYGTCLNNSTGVLAIIYKFIPKKDLNYKILSKNEFVIGFVPINKIFGDYKISQQQEVLENSLSHINSIWFNQYNHLQVFPKNFQVYTSFEFIRKFLDNITSFKESLGLENEKSIDLEGVTVGDLPKTLIEKFTSNSQVLKYQRWFNLNFIFIRAIDNLLVKLQNFELPDGPVSCLKDSKVELEAESRSIAYFIREYLYSVIIVSGYAPESDMDKFILLNYHNMIKGSGYLLPFIDESMTIELATDYVKESFTITKGEGYEHLINSNTDHQWSRCTLTLLPILEDDNRIDQLNQFNYTNGTYEGLARVLLDTLNYCIITGNKIYETG